MEKKWNENELIYLYDGKPLAHVTFKVGEGDLTILSTVVDPSLRGRGIAKSLMEDIEGYAEKNGYKIKAVCSYAVKYFSNGDHPLYLG